MISFANLVRKQKRLQKGKNRSRNIDDYSTRFDVETLSRILGDNSWNKGAFEKLVEHYIKLRGCAVWNDLGCGNAIPLRQAKMYAESLGYKPEVVRAYGFDALPVDRKEIRKAMKKFPHRLRPDLLKRKYNPKIIRTDITTVEFPENPDIVSCIEVLHYTEDPLKVFANAARQAPIGATFCISDLNAMHYSEDPKKPTYDAHLFERIDDMNGTIPGFRVLGFHISDDLILIKESEQKDFTYGYLRLDKKPHWMGYSQVYTYRDNLTKK
jgi:SAM-dependent methyltransferase